MIWNNDTVRQIERDSIRNFLVRNAFYFQGRTLDFGAGEQPYRDIVRDAGASYAPYDRLNLPGCVARSDIGADDPLGVAGDAPMYLWRTILCTQVVQYVEDVPRLLRQFARAIESGGHLVMTYPTTWAEVEPSDLHRFTRAGMGRSLTREGFTIVRHERRAEINLGGFELALGYGVVAEA